MIPIWCRCWTDRKRIGWQNKIHACNPLVTAEGGLREPGYDRVLATDAAQTLTLPGGGCERFRPVFSDVVMPDMDGITLAHKIRRRYPQLPVILASGYSEVLAAHGSGGFELLHKPCAIEQLSHRVRTAPAGR